MKRHLLTGVAAAALVGMVAAPNQAPAAPVGMELSLLVDVSGSINVSQYTLQMEGYASAFETAAVQDAIDTNDTNSIAVQMIQWSNSEQQSEVIGWTQITPATADAFAATIRGTARAFSDTTAPQSAMSFAATNLANDFESDRQVMDVSGDGVSNADPQALRPDGGRTAALAAGYDTISGLVVGGNATILAYYQNNVIGGENSFVDAVDSFNDFGPVIEAKLEREIMPPIPIPGAVWMFGSGLVALFGFTRRKIPARA